MSLRKTAVAAALALSMASGPVLAQSAAPLSVAASVNRSGAPTGQANKLFEEDYWLPLALFTAVIIAIILLNKHSNNDLPHSA